MRITALKQSLASVLADMDGILQVATDDNARDLTAEENTAFEAKQAEAKRLQGAIAREQTLLDAKASAAQPVIVPQNGPGAAGGGRVEPQVKEKLEAGIGFTRIVTSLAAANMDQRAAAAHAETIYGSDFGQIVGNMEQATNVKGGFLVNTAYSSDFIDILRPRVVVRQLGARTVPMPDGNLTQRKKTAGTQASYIGERVPAPTTDVSVGQNAMSAKRLTALVPITNQLLRRASIAVDAMVRDDLLESVSLKEDQQFIRGVGSSTAPAGLKSLTAAGNVLVAGAGTDLVTVAKLLSDLILRVLQANVPMVSCGWIMSPRTMMFLSELRDGNGNLVYPSIQANGTLRNYPIGHTTSVPDNLGAGSNESEIYFGAFNQFQIGDTLNVAIAASDTAAYDDGGVIRSAFSNDETVIRIITEHDTSVRYDTAFSVATGVKWGT